MFMSGSNGRSILMSVPNLSGDTVVLGTEGADLQQFFCLSLIGIASLQPLLSVVAEI